MNLIWVCVLALVGVSYGARRVTRQYPYYPARVPYYPSLQYPAQPYASPYSSPLVYSPYVQLPMSGICKLVPAADPKVTGEIFLQQRGPLAPVEISGLIQGLAPGLHGFHIHQTGNVSDNCAAAGPHFNPNNHTHGAPTEIVRHAGDLGNIVVDPSGLAPIRIIDPLISLIQGNPLNVLGRAIVVHEKEDDLGKGGDEESLKTGNAGKRLACCVIEPIQSVAHLRK